MLTISNLEVLANGEKIIKNLSLSVPDGKIHALMGPNGSGKSTLAQTLMGHPNYEVTKGSALFNGKDLLKMSPTERSLAGMFLSFQYPNEVTGVTVSSFLRMIYNKHKKTSLSPVKFRDLLNEKVSILDMDKDFSDRYLNEGFSGGEKKRMEILQLLVLEPSFAILDETDSGLDVDALKKVFEGVNSLHGKSKMSVLLITHYARILKYIEIDKVHIMKSGEIIKEGDKALAHELEEKGYSFE